MSQSDRIESSCPAPDAMVTASPYDRLMDRLGLAGCGRRQVGKRVLFWVAVTWLPPLLLAGASAVGGSGGPVVGILKDIPFHARCLLAIPILVAAECHVALRISEVNPILLERDLIARESRERYQALRTRIQKLRDSAWIEALVLIVSISLLASQSFLDLPVSVLSWRRAESGLSLFAREYDQWIGITFYYFLGLRWIWRFALWCAFLVRVATLRPKLQSHHPDQSGGLSFVVHRHLRFAIAALAFSFVIAAKIALNVVQGGAKVDGFAYPVAFYLLIVVLTFAIPLLAFTPVLIMARRKGLDEYGTFANRYATDFDRKWIGHPGPGMESPLGTPDLQSLNDLDGSYSHQREMGVFLMHRKHFLALVGLVAMPFVPLLLFKVPLREVLKFAVKMVA